MSDVPHGWVVAPLDALLAPQADGRTIHQGWSPQCEKSPAGDSEWGALKTTAIQPGHFLPEHNKRLPVDKQPKPGLAVKPDDVLLTCAGPRSRCGVACLVSETRPKLMISGKMYRFRFDNRYLEPQFMEYYLLSGEAWSAIDEMKTGVSDSGLNLTQGRIRTLPIPVPPLPEQQRIVAAIEEHFSRLDAAEACLGSAAKRAARLPDAACSALTNDGSWRVVELTDLLTSLRNGAFVSRPSADPPGMPILRISAVRQRRLDQTDVRYATPAPAGADRYQVDPGDLLFTRYSGNPKYVGACAVVPPDAAGLLHPDKLIRGVVDEAQADPRWISSYVSVGAGRASIESRLKTTAGQVGISGRQLKSVEIAVPPIEEQIRRCNEIDRFSDLADSVGAAIDVAARRSSGLRRAVLAAAFSGQLVPQDPADEPASVLLERIAAERAAAKPPRRKRVTA